MANPVRVVDKAAAEQRQYQRRNLRIAIRQLERAELYIGALRSLELGDGADARVEDLLADLGDLHRHFLAEKAAS